MSTESRPIRSDSAPSPIDLIRLSVRWQFLAMAGLLIVIAAVFNFYSDGVFLAPRNLSLLLRQAAIIGIVASGVTMLIIMSEIDLSIGSAVYLVGVIAATVETRWGLNIWQVLVVALASGLALGTWQGFLVAKVGIPSFIVTLAGLLTFRGVGLYWTDARTISPLIEEHVALAENFIPAGISMVAGIAVAALAVAFIARRGASRRRRGDKKALPSAVVQIVVTLAAIGAFLFAVGGYRGTPTAVLWTLAIGAGLWFLTSSTVFGRNAYMIGANRQAASLAGINVERNVFLGFVLMGALYGIAGILYTARLNASTAGDATFMELDAIAAAVIGGVALSGGKGRIPAVIGGALLLTAIDNGMSVMGVSTFFQQIVKGGILLAAVALDARSRRR